MTTARDRALQQSGVKADVRQMLDADPQLVHSTYRGAAATMLEAIAQPDVFGEHLGIELGVEGLVTNTVTAYVNYSYQPEPEPDGFDISELNLPSQHHFNIGAGYNGAKWLGNAAVSNSTPYRIAVASIRLCV